MGHAVSVIFPVLTVIIGGACILLFSVTTTLRANNSDLTDRVGLLEKERDDLKRQGQADREVADAKLAAVNGELEALRKVVTGEAHLLAITDLLTVHHTEALAQWTNLGTALDQIDTGLTRVAEAMERET